MDEQREQESSSAICRRTIHASCGTVHRVNVRGNFVCVCVVGGGGGGGGRDGYLSEPVCSKCDDKLLKMWRLKAEDDLAKIITTNDNCSE